MSKKALLVAINNYPDDSNLQKLRFAEADAQALGKKLETDCGFQVQYLLGKDASRDNIEQAVFEAGSGDTFLFFFAGHGQLIRGQYKLHAYSSKGASGVGALAFTEISDLWKTDFGFKNVMAIIDACRIEMAGARGNRGLQVEETRDISAATNSGSNWVEVLYGCSEGQLSYEIEELGHGLLTHAILQAMERFPHGLDSRLLAEEAADLMVDWCEKDTEGRVQYAHRYARPSRRHRVMIIPGTVEVKDGPQLSITSDPPNAKIIIDGEARGRAPLSLALPAGSYTIQARRAGCEDWIKTFDFHKDAEVPIQLTRSVQPPIVYSEWPFSQSEARRRQQETARRMREPAFKELDLGKGISMKFALIPAGEFMMGSPDDEEGRWDSEGPVHRVHIEQPFWLAAAPVTVQHFTCFTEATAYQTEAEREGFSHDWDGKEWKEIKGRHWGNPSFDQSPDHPVTCISWNDCQEFLHWAAESSGIALGLPSEAQAEYAIRCGEEATYPWGDDPDEGEGFANCADLTTKEKFTGDWTPFHWESGYVYTSPVASFKPNSWGLLDTIGNVWEWCEDTFHESYKGAPSDGSAWIDNDRRRVLRGGSWNSDPRLCRSACRSRDHAGSRYRGAGFRCFARDF